MSYKTIIFDLGKVIFDYSWDHMYEYYAKLAKLSPAEVRGRLAIGHDPVFLDFERGVVSTPEYMAHVEKLLEIRMTIPEFADGLNAIYEEAFEGIESILGELELQFLLVALSNTNPVHATEFRERYADQLVYFSYIFCSHELHSRKPEPIIYEQVLRSVGSVPGDCIFFDDRADNVEGARAVGIQAFQVSSPAEIRSALKELGI